MKVIDWLKKSGARAPSDLGARVSPEPPARADADQAEGLRGEVIASLRGIHDPEIPVNIYDLGLIYDLSIDEAAGRVAIRMTLTAPGCPVARTFPETVAKTVGKIDAVQEVDVELVWDPPWNPARMSEAARLQLGML